MEKLDTLQRQLNDAQDNLEKERKEAMKFDINQTQFRIKLNDTKVKLNDTQETTKKLMEKIDSPRGNLKKK